MAVTHKADICSYVDSPVVLLKLVFHVQLMLYGPKSVDINSKRTVPGRLP